LLVDWICECGDAHRLASSTSHVAVGLMDKVLQMLEVKRDRYQMVALTCLIVAAKYEEKEESVPSMRRLCEYVEKRQGARAAQMCSADIVHNMEVLLLSTLGWKVTIVTPLHYLGLFERVVRGPGLCPLPPLPAPQPPPSHLTPPLPPSYYSSPLRA
jgi:hypothetical protein